MRAVTLLILAAWVVIGGCVLFSISLELLKFAALAKWVFT